MLRMSLIVGSCAGAVALLVTQGPRVAGAPAETRPPCVLASVGAYPVTTRHVRELRASLRPPPPQERARRLVVDAAVAFADSGSALEGSRVEDWLAAYRRFVASARGSVPEMVAEFQPALAAMRERVGVLTGACP